MKYKILTTLIASALLAGCYDYNEPNEATPSKSVQAFDGAIQGIKGKFECEGGVSGVTGKTDYYGFVKVTNQTFVEHPETCSFTFVPTPGAVDTSNGKPMDKVSYTAPKGLFKKGQPAAASPITTLVAKKLEKSGEEYSPEAATEVLIDLGLNTSLVDTTALLTAPEKTLKDLEKEDPKGAFQKVAAVTFMLSDALTAQGDKKSVEEITEATKKLSEKIVKDNPDFPKAEDGKFVKESFVEVLEDTATFDDVADPQETELPKTVTDKTENPETGDPVQKPEPEKPATGGTGGSGAHSASAGGGGA